MNSEKFKEIMESLRTEINQADLNLKNVEMTVGQVLQTNSRDLTTAQRLWMINIRTRLKFQYHSFSDLKSIMFSKVLD